MTATTTTRPRPTLEALVDRLIDAVFDLDPTHQPTASPAQRVHEARRLRRAGDLDGALRVFAELDLGTATESERRWAYAEWVDAARRRFDGQEALIYSPATGRAAALTPQSGGALEVRAVLGLRWRPVKLVSRRSLRGVKPLTKRGAW